MGIWDRIKKDTIDVIEWRDPSGGVWAYRFNRNRELIRYSALLVVRPHQTAAIAFGDEITDLLPPGNYILNQHNLPNLAQRQQWKEGIHNAITADIYFLNTRDTGKLKWNFITGTSASAPANLNGSGEFTFRITSPDLFIHNVCGFNTPLTQEYVIRQLQKLIGNLFVEYLDASPSSYSSENGGCRNTEKIYREKMQPRTLNEFGFELVSLTLDSLPSKDKQEAQEPAAVPDELTIPENFQLYLAVNGTQTGPFNMDELRRMIRSGLLKHDHLVWKKGMPSWEKAHNLPEIQLLFAE